MDSYIEAFRWASDRIGDEGVVCFVSNAGWLRSDAGAGVRKCFSEEFSSICVFDLLGNQRTQGEESRRQGGKVFGSGCRAPIAITMLVKNPSSSEHGAIHYFSVGEYKTQEEKLSCVASYRDRDPEWETLEQDRHGDWLGQRDESWYEFAYLGLNNKAGKAPNGIFELYSRGFESDRDAWIYNYSRETLAVNIQRTLEKLASEAVRTGNDPKIATAEQSEISWSRTLRNKFSRGIPFAYHPEAIVGACYRPFVKTMAYTSTELVDYPGQQPLMFPLIRPNECAENITISVVYGNRKFSALAANAISDIQFAFNGQCFPLYWYEKDDGSTMLLMADEGEKVVRDAWGNRYIRHDAITDDALRVFRDAYPTAYAARPKTRGGAGISKEDVFWYVYGILHSPKYRERFSANLQKELPRIPLAANFEAFCEAGRALGKLHLGYENVEPWPGLEIRGVLPGMDPGRVEKLKWGSKRNPETGKLEKDYTTLVYNKQVTIRGIPEGAQYYVVNGRSPLEWMIDRYQVKTDKATGIVNDPNEYSNDPRYILDLICKLVTVAMNTNEIVANLPAINEIEKPASWPVAWEAGV